jgi:ABC-2 type transport system ATP-binding protein
MSSIPILTVSQITKTFAANTAVNEVSFELMEGQILGLLGPNGCGKSTLFKIILGLMLPNSGQVTVLGQSDADQYRKQLSVALDDHYFDPNWTGLANLKATAVIKGCTSDQYMPWAEALDMKPALNKQVRQYSFGMRKRLSLIAALMKPADLYILDEPGNGLDIPGIVLVRQILQDLKSKGKTVILSSHLLGDVERTCTHIGLMNQGKLFEYGLTETVIGPYASLEDSFMAKLNHKSTELPFSIPPILPA